MARDLEDVATRDFWDIIDEVEHGTPSTEVYSSMVDVDEDGKLERVMVVVSGGEVTDAKVLRDDENTEIDVSRRSEG